MDLQLVNIIIIVGQLSLFAYLMSKLKAANKIENTYGNLQSIGLTKRREVYPIGFLLSIGFFMSWFLVFYLRYEFLQVNRIYGTIFFILIGIYIFYFFNVFDKKRYYKCPYCDYMTLLKEQYQCQHCDNIQKHEKFYSDKCDFCKTSQHTAFCEKCRKEFII